MLVTNRHVIFNNAREGDEIEIELYYGKVPENFIPDRLSAKIIKRTLSNEDPDLALLEVKLPNPNFPRDVKSLSMAEGVTSKNIPILIVGNSFQWQEGKLTDINPNGLILEPLLKPGISGSPVLNLQNAVMGVVYLTDGDPNTGKFSYANSINLVTQKVKEWGF
jgi:hypothetical protein